MNYKRLFCIVVFGLMACAAYKDVDPVNMQLNDTYDNVETKSKKGWELIFDEEFEGNLNNWDVWETGSFNNELQYYGASGLEVKNGNLHILAKRQAAKGRTNPINSAIRDFEFTSGRIESKQLFGSEPNKPIRILAKIKLPKGEGLWPAFWTYGKPWPSEGEIDIMEFRGNNPTQFSTAYHYGPNGNDIKTRKANNVFEYNLPTCTKDFSEKAFVYELYWSTTELRILLDGKLIHIIKEPTNEYLNSFLDKKHNIILNLAIGGSFFPSVNKNAIPNQSEMIVEWVRVYKKQ
ncbi:MAG: glycoside hydrolase family 16 protein [Leadbetterella sp.]